MLNAGPSEWVADSMLIVAGLSRGNSTRCERQSAALLQASDIDLKVMLYVASSNPHLLTLLFDFFHYEISLVVCGHCILLFQLLEGNNSILSLCNIQSRLPVLWYSISIECQQMCTKGKLLEILFHHVPGKVVLQRCHWMHLYKL